MKKITQRRTTKSVTIFRDKSTELRTRQMGGGSQKLPYRLH